MNRGSVIVFSERQDVALELLSAGRTLAGEAEVISIVIESDAEKAAREQIAHGADVVLIVEPGEGADPVYGAGY